MGFSLNNVFKKNLLPEAGRFLLAEPFLSDPYFKRSVILLGEHGEEGSVGFIVNKPTPVRLNDVLNGFPVMDVPVYFGGPVQTDTVNFIHTAGDRLTGGKEISKGIYLGGDVEVLKQLIDTRLILPDDIRFFVGYSGWDPDQFRREIQEKSWIVSPENKKFTFSKRPETLWSEILRSMGGEYAVISNFPEDPSLN